MTYCLALRLDAGLVLMSDTRTNAGVDNVSNYRKLHVLRPAPDRIFVLQSAGNLATTQEVLDRIHHDLQAPGGAESLATVDEMYEAALYVGRLSRTVVDAHRNGLMSSGADGTATFILGGQIRGRTPDVMLIYPEGNYIRASDERPFLQIGESKYGKFMLDIAVRSHADLAAAAKIALASMISTARANLSVGPPYDLAVYRTDTLELEEFRITEDSVILRRLLELWEKHIMAALHELPVVTDLDELAGEPAYARP
ncbi:20S proteasome subunit A/B [Nakamurella sp.]|uniref:20S proteasome subunit A/B n=1 Tax=Nakamurella sp. TaxID=1869182 RepID=UPI003B3B203A